MLLGVLSQNVIGMGWKMNDLRMSISTWVKFNSAPLDVKKNKLFLENLIIVKPPNEAQNYVESFLIKIFTKIQMWLVN